MDKNIEYIPILLSEEDLMNYERDFGLIGFIPETLPKYDTKQLAMQRLIANVRILKDLANALIKERNR